MDNIQKATIFNEAAAIVRKGWCKGYYAMTAEGRGIKPTAKRACRFCALGAIRRAVYNILGEDCKLSTDITDGVVMDGAMLECAEIVHKSLRLKEGSNGLGKDITKWNDRKHNNGEKVAKKYERIANLLQGAKL